MKTEFQKSPRMDLFGNENLKGCNLNEMMS